MRNMYGLRSQLLQLFACFFDKRLQLWLNFRETSRETFQPAHDLWISMSQRNHQVRPSSCKKIKPNGVWLFRCSPLDSAGCTLNSTTVTEIGDMLHTFVRKRHANSAMHWTAINMSTWPTWYIRKLNSQWYTIYKRILLYSQYDNIYIISTI